MGALRPIEPKALGGAPLGQHTVLDGVGSPTTVAEESTPT